MALFQLKSFAEIIHQSELIVDNISHLDDCANQTILGSGVTQLTNQIGMLVKCNIAQKSAPKDDAYHTSTLPL